MELRHLWAELWVVLNAPFPLSLNLIWSGPLHTINLIIVQFNFKLAARVMKFSLQSYSVNSNSAHPKVDIYNYIWKNEISLSDVSDVSILLMAGILFGIVLATVSCFGFLSHFFPLEKFQLYLSLYLRKTC